MLYGGRVRRLLGGAAKVSGQRTGSESGRLRKILAGDLVDLDRKRESLELAEGRSEFINGVVRNRDGAVASGIHGFELIVRIQFLAGLKARQDPLASQTLELSAIEVDAVFGVNPVPVLFQQPIDSVGVSGF